MKKIFLALLILCPFIFAANSFAQQETGVIKGVVVDFNGGVMPGITVKLDTKDLSAEKTFSRTAATDKNGEFTMVNLLPGEYVMSASKYEILTYKNSHVIVTASRTTKLTMELNFGGECEPYSAENTITITDDDSADIVNQILESDLTDKSIPDYQILAKQKGKIVLSTENIKAEWIKPSIKANLKLMTQSEIQDRADRKSDFPYLSISFRIINKCVRVTLNNSWAVGKNSPKGYLSGGAHVYIFHVESGKWTGKSVGGWIN
jgi:hypothetical protein